MTTTMPDDRPVALLSAPQTRRFLNDFVKRRVGPSDADDVVQTVLCDALQAARIPDTESEMRRWLTGIARHKIADLHRKAGREQPTELPDIETTPAPVEERLMAEWAEEQVPKTTDAERTLRWMAREGEGEKLEQIAAEEKVEAATVRQRVSRMRRWMKERWIAELAAVAVIAFGGLFVWRWLKSEPVEVVREPNGTATPDLPPLERAVAVRRGALDACHRAEYRMCIDGLDRARELDPAGDSAPEVREARDAAKKAFDLETQGPQSIPQKSIQQDSGPQYPVPVNDSKDNSFGPTPSSVPTANQKSGPPKATPFGVKQAPKAPPLSTESAPFKPAPKPATPSDFGPKKSSSTDFGTGSKDEGTTANNAPVNAPPQSAKPAEPPSQQASPPPAQQAPQLQSQQQYSPLDSSPVGTSSLRPQKGKRSVKK